MKCINCGAEIKPEFKICPYCGTASQIVPDYSVYDEESIHVIQEKATPVEPVKQPVEKKVEQVNEQKDEDAAKQRRMKLTISFVTIACMLVIITGVVAKVFIDNNNSNSYDYQMKQADAAMFKGDIDAAEEYYLKALALNSDSIAARLELADLYLEKEETTKAKKYLKEVIARDDINYEAYKMLYKIYDAEDDTDAILALKEGVTDNKILSIFSDYSVEGPSLHISGGTYNEDIKLIISAKKGLEIYYNLEGLDPRTEGTLYTSAIEITGAGMHKVKVVTKNSLGVYSDVVTETYVIKYDAPADPVVTPTGGSFDEKTYITIVIPSGCTAYYTWDRTDPTEESNKYEGPIIIPEGKNMLTVIIVNDKTGMSSAPYRGIYDSSYVLTEDDLPNTSSDSDITEGEGDEE